MENKIIGSEGLSDLEARILGLEGVVAGLESLIQATKEGSDYTAWLDLLTAQVNALKANADKPPVIQDIPDIQMPVIEGGNVLPPIPTVPSVLAWDATNYLHWAELDADYKVPQRKADDTVGGDYVRAV
jgi:hypothetical protein